MKPLYATIAAALALGMSSSALAVSDGNYEPSKQHCRGDVDNSDAPTRTAQPQQCYSIALTIRDGDATKYHEYFGIGLQQQPDSGRSPLVDLNPVPLSIGKKQTVDVWYDPDGTPAKPDCKLFSFTFDVSNFDQCNVTPSDWLTKDLPNSTPPSCSADPNGATPPTMTGPIDCNFAAGGSTAPPVPPPTGLHLYFGADDNFDAGEHDSSNFVNNGPSDGGSIVLNLDPASIMTWMARAMAQDVPGLLTHPLPLADAGLGLCADGFCFSAQTTQRPQAYSGGAPPPSGNGQDVANYQGRKWDTYDCSGPDDGPGKCGGHTLDYWNGQNGDPSIEPGVQIYEDPDAQGSPAGPVYPIPAIYVGTCGVIIGGGALDSRGSLGSPFPDAPNQSLGFPPTAQAAPGAPYVNDAGQLVIATDCHGEQKLP